jgi:hypothetical protein
VLVEETGKLQEDPPAPEERPGEPALKGVGNVLIDDTAVGLKPAAVVATKWEYKVIRAGAENDEQLFSDMGKEGWELVGVAATSSDSRGRWTRAYFKRPMQAAEKPANKPAVLKSEELLPPGS